MQFITYKGIEVPTKEESIFFYGLAIRGPQHTNKQA